MDRSGRGSRPERLCLLWLSPRCGLRYNLGGLRNPSGVVAYLQSVVSSMTTCVDTCATSRPIGFLPQQSIMNGENKT